MADKYKLLALSSQLLSELTEENILVFFLLGVFF